MKKWSLKDLVDWLYGIDQPEEVVASNKCALEPGVR